MRTSKKGLIYRQGDVWLYPITEKEFTENTSKKVVKRSRGEKGLILAEGEVTGHHHRIVKGGRLYSTNGHVRLLSAGGPLQLVHEEHSTLDLPAGKYEVRIQREYEPQAVSRQSYVRD